VSDDVPWLDRTQLRSWVRLVAVLELLPGVLDAQLRREAGITHFEYYVLAMLSESDERTLRMSDLARITNATPPRLSHVVRRLEDRGLVERFPCPTDARSTNAQLTEKGLQKVVEAAPGHVRTVRRHVIDALDDGQVHQVGEICEAILARLDPTGSMAGAYRRYDDEPGATAADPA
jgi:DNA-binding MarR family transcriptional regulator